MASPTLTLINAATPTDGVLSDADANTGWSNLTTPDTDIKVEGTGSESGVARADNEDSYFDAGVAGVTPGTAVGKILRGWVNTTNVPYMQPEATNPYELYCYDSSSTSGKLALFGSDTYPGGWFYFWQAMDDFTVVTLANVDRWGITTGHSGNSKNVINMWMDILRYMDGYYLTGGTDGDEVTFLTLGATDLASAYGVVQDNFEVFFCTGEIQIGNGATTTFFKSDGDVIVFLDSPGALSIAAGLYEIRAEGSGCNCDIQNSVIKANGTGDTTRFILDFSDATSTTVFVDNLITRASTIAFALGQSPTGNIFDDCGQITHAGADMDSCVIKNYEGTADTAALLYAVNADPNGEMDNMSFTKGTASTHAIEFDATNTPTTITLTGIDFSGYNASNGNTDSALYFPSTTKSYTVNLSGCTGNISYKVGVGGSVTLVSDPVALTFTVKDGDDSSLLTGARVLVWPTSAANFQYQSSVTTLTGSGTLVTATKVAHGFSTNDYVWIEGANEDDYNGVHQVTVNSTSEYEYTIAATVSGSPATGTITATYIMITDTTDGSGEATNSWELGADQPFGYRVRKSTGSPYFIQASGTDTILTTADKDITIQLTRDG